MLSPSRLATTLASKPAPGRRPSTIATTLGAADHSQATPFPQRQASHALETTGHHDSPSEHALAEALRALGAWSCSSDPGAFLRTMQRVLFSHPIVYQLPSLQLAIAHSYLSLGDVSSCLRHLLEAQRLVSTSHHRRESPFIQAKISSVAYGLAVTARTKNNDPLKCLMYLNLVFEEKYRVPVLLQTAHCLLMMGDVEAALPLFLDLAEQTRDPDAVLVCARIYATLHQLPAMCSVLNELRALDPEHPGIPDLDAMLHVQVDQYQVEATKLSYLRQYNDVLQVLALGLELVPTHPELLMLKAETLFALGNPDDLLAFLATWPPNVPGGGKIVRFKVAALEKLLHHHWSSANYQAALSTLDRLRAVRPESSVRDRLWNCQLRFLAFGLDGSGTTTAVDAKASKLAESGMRLLEQDLLQYLADLTNQNDINESGSADEIGTAEALLCQVYARRARQVLARGSTQGQGPNQWREGLKLLDKAIDTSFPRVAGLGDPELPAFPELLSMFPKSIPADQYPLWAQALPVDCQAAALWLEKSRVLDKLAETEKAIAGARAALVLVPGNLEAKQWLLELTGDQDELARLAAVQVAQKWAKEKGVAIAEATPGNFPPDVPSNNHGDSAAHDGTHRTLSPPPLGLASKPTTASLAPASTASAHDSAPVRVTAPTRRYQPQLPIAASSHLAPMSDPAATQLTHPKLPKTGANPAPDATVPVSSGVISDMVLARRSKATALVLPAVLMGTRVSVTSMTHDPFPAQSALRVPTKPAVKGMGSKKGATLHVPPDDLGDAPGAAAAVPMQQRRALGPPPALTQAISKHYQVLLGQYGISGLPGEYPMDMTVYGTGAWPAGTRPTAARGGVPAIDIVSLANDGPAAAAYVTQAVEDKVKRDMVQAHQMAEMQRVQLGQVPGLGVAHKTVAPSQDPGGQKSSGRERVESGGKR